MKKLVITLTLFLIHFYSFTQNEIIFHGKVLDENKKPVILATIKLYVNNKIVGTAISDSLGLFTISHLQQKSYLIEVTFIGYKTFKTEIIADNHAPISIYLLPENNELKAVSVSTKKPLIERKLDRMIFNVENSISSIGGDGIEILSKSPGVIVINDNISIVGKSNVSVMINDKILHLAGEDLVNYIKTISAANISRIEVITNPPSQFDAQGNSGLINIVLKKNLIQGYNGSVRGTYLQSKYSILTSGFDFNYNTKKSILNTTFDLSNGSNSPLLNHTLNYTNSEWDVIRESQAYKNYSNNTLNWEYRFNDTTSLQLSYIGNFNNPNANELTTTKIYNAVRTLDTILKTPGYTNRNLSNNNIGIQFNHQFGKSKNKLEISTDYFLNKDNRSKLYSNEVDDVVNNMIYKDGLQYQSGNLQNIKIWTFKAQVESPIKNGKIICGLKNTSVSNLNNITLFNIENNIYTPDLNQQNYFNYSEVTNAIFFSLTKSFTNFDYNIGLRAENTTNDGSSENVVDNSLHKNYTKLFPTIFFTYKINDSNNLSFYFGRRIDRPQFFQLNPFKWISGQYSYSQGNPQLQPSYENNIELSYTYNNAITTALSFSKEENASNQITFVDNATKIEKVTILNFLTNFYYQLATSYSYSKIPWLENSTQFVFYYNKSISYLEASNKNFSGFSGYVSTDNQFIFNKSKTFFGSVNASYYLPQVQGIYNNSEWYRLDIGLKYIALKSKLQTSLTLNDIFRSATPHWSAIINGVNQQFKNYYDYRSIRLSFKYKFGSNKPKTIQHENSNTDEKVRVG